MGGGGALRYQTATPCQTAAWRGSGECQNIGAINSFEGKKSGAVNFKLICKMCLFSLYFMKYLMLITLHALLNNWSPFVYNFALRKFDFRGRWSATPKNRGRSKKTQGWTGLKSGGCSLVVTPPSPRDIIILCSN